MKKFKNLFIQIQIGIVNKKVSRKMIKIILMKEINWQKFNTVVNSKIKINMIRISSILIKNKKLLLNNSHKHTSSTVHQQKVLLLHLKVLYNKLNNLKFNNLNLNQQKYIIINYHLNFHKNKRS
jgi:hypothetical protein